MIPIDNTIVSDNLAEIKFVCDLKKNAKELVALRVISVRRYLRKKSG